MIPFDPTINSPKGRAARQALCRYADLIHNVDFEEAQRVRTYVVELEASMTPDPAQTELPLDPKQHTPPESWL